METANTRTTRPWRLWLLASLICLVPTIACHTMKPIEPTQLTSTSVSRIWVTESDRTTVVLDAPRIDGDTLAGFVDGQYREMLLSETQGIKALAPAPGKTAAVGVAVGVAALSLFVYLANRSYVGDGQTCYIPKTGDVVPCCAGQSTVSC